MPLIVDTPFLTYALIGINVFLWVLMTAAGGSKDSDVLLRFGAMYGPLIAAGQYWRLFTSMFLHVGMLHLAFNGFGLLIFGRIVERVFGRPRFITIYVLAGLAGGVASYLLNSISIAAGASGAIFGILGAFAAFFVVQRKVLGEMGRQTLYGILVLAAINLAFGLAIPGIDNWAHMGGFAMGFALGLLLAPRYRILRSEFGMPIGLRDANPLARRLWVIPAAAVLLGLGAWLATATLPDNPVSRLHSAERYIQEKDSVAALNEVQRAIDLDPLNGDAHYLRGRVLADLDDFAGAQAELVLAIRLGDRDAAAKAIELLMAIRSRR